MVNTPRPLRRAVIHRLFPSLIEVPARVASSAGKLVLMTGAFESQQDGPTVGQFPISGLVRRARRLADFSQRQLAAFARVSAGTVSRVEAGRVTPSLEVLERLLGAAGLFLVVVDQNGRVVKPLEDTEDLHDGAERRYPAHLDTILDPVYGEWWADRYGLARPPETFHRDRRWRDLRRRRSQWEVRVAQYRYDPPPPER